MKRTLALLFSFLLVLLIAMPVSAVETQSATNRFIFDDTVTSTQNTEGDLGAFGNMVTVGGSVTGDVFAFGNNVKVDCEDVAGNVIAMGSTLSIDAATTRNIYAAANMVTVFSNAKANGAYLAGSTVTFSGTAQELYAAGGLVTIDGTVLGNAVITSDELRIGDSAKINGTLTIYAAEEPMLPASIDPSTVHFVQTESAHRSRTVKFVDTIRQGALSILTAAALAVLLTLLFSKFLKARADELRTKVGWSLLWGLLVFIVMPIAAVIVMITVIGIPIGFILLLLYGVLLYLAPAYTGAVLGRLVLKNTNKYLAAMAGAAVVRLVMIIPVLGTLVYFACAFYALGSLIMNLKLNEKDTGSAMTIEQSPVI